MRYDNFMMSANLNVALLTETDATRSGMWQSKTTVIHSGKSFALCVCPACGRHILTDMFSKKSQLSYHTAYATHGSSTATFYCRNLRNALLLHSPALMVLSSCGRHAWNQSHDINKNSNISQYVICMQNGRSIHITQVDARLIETRTNEKNAAGVGTIF